MNVMNILLGISWRAIKCQDQQAEHVKGGEARSDNTYEPKYPAEVCVIPRTPQHRIFAEETPQRRDSRKGSLSNNKSSKHPWQSRTQYVHFSHGVDCPH